MGNCSNGVRISRAGVERPIMTALKEKLLAPDLIAEFTRAYQEEVNRLAATAGSRRADGERQLKAVERKIRAIADAVENGLYALTMIDRMRPLEGERLALREGRPVVQSPAPVLVHPNLAELYRRRVADLEQLLADPELGSEASAGDLARILPFCSRNAPKQNAQAVGGSGRLGVSAYEVSVVAGT